MAAGHHFVDQAVDRVVKWFESQGYQTRTEVQIKTPNGAKSSRFADIVAYKDGEVKVIQVGKQNLNGTSVARELRADDDIEAITGMRPDYVPYNVANPNYTPSVVPEGGPPEAGGPEGEGSEWEVPSEPEVIPE